MFGRTSWGSALLFTLALPTAMLGVPSEVTFSQSAASVEAYDFVEVTANVAGPDAPNPFTDVTVRGSFAKAGQTERTLPEV